MKLRPYMQEVSRHANDHGMVIYFWRRQAGKTTTLGWISLKVMAAERGRLVTMVSCSLNVGAELTEKEAMIYREIIGEMRTEATGLGLKLTTTADEMLAEKGYRERFDDFQEMLDKSKLEVRLYHTSSIYSRTKIIAPNVATARGYSGWVLLDEFGFMPDFKSIFEAVEPITSSDPTFRIIMATTPPNDDTHYSYELLVPPDGMEFFPNPRGNWYESQAGVTVHRLDAEDAFAAGLPLYDRKRNAVPWPVFRAQAIDREAADRNYGLCLKAGGTGACSLLAMQTAQRAGALTCVACEDDFPVRWKDFIVRGAPTVIAMDPATTEKAQSNPSGLVIAQRVGGRVRYPVVIRYKSADDRVQKAMLREACDLPDGMKPLRIGIDATNEKFFARQISREFRDIAPVDRIVMSELPDSLSEAPARERMIFKSFLGNLLVNALDDGGIELPQAAWVKDDWRLVKRSKGGFDTDVDTQGGHGDTFDAAKIAWYLLTVRGGPSMVEAVRVGSGIFDRPERSFNRQDTSSDYATPEERVAI